MKKTLKKTLLVSSALILASATVVAVPFIVSAVRNKNISLIAINDEFLSKEKEFLNNNSAALPAFNVNEPEKVFDELTKNARDAIVALTDLKNNNTLNQNETIWTDSYILQWEIKQKNIEAGTFFLGANPINGDQILSTSSNHIRKYVSDAVNIYPINEATGDPDTSATPDNSLVNNLLNKISQASEIVQQYQTALEAGMSYGYMPSSIQKKALINQLLGFFYREELNVFATSSANKINLADLVNQTTTNNYFQSIYKDIIDKSTSVSKDLLQKKLDELRNSINEFIKFYGGVEYYGSSDSYGPETSGKSIELTKTNNNEIERTLVTSNGTQIYGVGFTQTDLDTPNIGIGHMKIKASDFAYIKQNGNDIYQQLLFNNNSIDDLAADIYKQGIEFSKAGVENMKTLATQAKSLIIGNLTSNIIYDNDGIGPNAPASTALTGTTDFAKFNQWLNQEDFFWGREYFATTSEQDAFIDKYWNNASGDLAKYKDIIIQQGYKDNWSNQSTINGLATGTVSGNQALAGAVLSLNDYIDFKIKTDGLFDNSFNPIDDYVISPYNYNIREDVGVGLEGPRGSKQFQYNCDPYYSLPKWSVSSLTTHEGKMGHHTQQQYWTQYLQGGDGKNNVGPGYTFTNGAFHEGWAVFAEWYTNELEVYGSNLDSITRMPTDWTHAKGLVPNWDPTNSELTEQMKNLHGGVYFNKVIGDNDQIKTENSIKLANMLQYYGFLNEAQLRNMRMALDTAIHHNASNGDSSLPYGASIQQIRKFMTDNSALSIGDINSESIRYAVMPSQATGYMLGKVIFENLYKGVAKTLNTNLVNDKVAVKKLFDLFLRNGEIPLKVLEEQVQIEYKLKN